MRNADYCSYPDVGQASKDSDTVAVEVYQPLNDVVSTMKEDGKTSRYSSRSPCPTIRVPIFLGHLKDSFWLDTAVINNM